MTCSGIFPILLSKLSQWSNLTSNLKSVTSITLISMCMVPYYSQFLYLRGHCDLLSLSFDFI